jgi:hypothetical protein
MKGSTRRLFGAAKLATVLVTVLAMWSSAVAQPYTIADGNSVALLDTGSSAGLYSWKVDGNEQLAKQWFWYRINGSGPESDLSTISAAPTVTQAYGPGGRDLTAVYANSQVSVSLGYSMSGPGLALSIMVSNQTASTLSFQLFQYSDFNLGNTQGGQTVNFLWNGIRYYKAVQYYAGMTNTFLVTGVNPMNGIEANTFANTLTSLTDAGTTTLNGAASAFGDVTYAASWNLSIAAGQTKIISETITLNVPEPGPASLLLAGLLSWRLLRRRS